MSSKHIVKRRGTCHRRRTLNEKQKKEKNRTKEFTLTKEFTDDLVRIVRVNSYQEIPRLTHRSLLPLPYVSSQVEAVKWPLGDLFKWPLLSSQRKDPRWGLTTPNLWFTPISDPGFLDQTCDYKWVGRTRDSIRWFFPGLRGNISRGKIRVSYVCWGQNVDSAPPVSGEPWPNESFRL